MVPCAIVANSGAYSIARALVVVVRPVFDGAS
jgi:hypothetical protein